MHDKKAPLIRLWDGRKREAKIWAFQDNSPEIFSENGNCLVYLRDGKSDEQKPALQLAFDLLVYGKCTPLIKQTVSEDAPASAQRSIRGLASPTATFPDGCCSLYLGAPPDYQESEAFQYHITSRNFFAWLVGAPLVGPDPASAMLALKIRMDEWRAPFTDNFASLHDYAKKQGYGDLADLNDVIRRHLRGSPIVTSGYNFVSSTGDDDVQERGRSKRPRPRSMTSANFIPAAISKTFRNVSNRITLPIHSLPSTEDIISVQSGKTLEQDVPVITGAVIHHAMPRELPAGVYRGPRNTHSMTAIPQVYSRPNSRPLSAQSLTSVYSQGQGKSSSIEGYSVLPLLRMDTNPVFSNLTNISPISTDSARGHQNTWIHNLSKEHSRQLTSENSSFLNIDKPTPSATPAQTPNVPVTTPRHSRTQSTGNITGTNHPTPSRLPSPITEEVHTPEPLPRSAEKRLAVPEDQEAGSTQHSTTLSPDKVRKRHICARHRAMLAAKTASAAGPSDTLHTQITSSAAAATVSRQSTLRDDRRRSFDSSLSTVSRFPSLRGAQVPTTNVAQPEEPLVDPQETYRRHSIIQGVTLNDIANQASSRPAQQRSPPHVARRKFQERRNSAKPLESNPTDVPTHTNRQANEPSGTASSSCTSEPTTVPDRTDPVTDTSTDVTPETTEQRLPPVALKPKALRIRPTTSSTQSKRPDVPSRASSIASAVSWLRELPGESSYITPSNPNPRYSTTSLVSETFMTSPLDESDRNSWELPASAAAPESLAAIRSVRPTSSSHDDESSEPRGPCYRLPYEAYGPGIGDARNMDRLLDGIGQIGRQSSLKGSSAAGFRQVSDLSASMFISSSPAQPSSPYVNDDSKSTTKAKKRGRLLYRPMTWSPSVMRKEKKPQHTFQGLETFEKWRSDVSIQWPEHRSATPMCELSA